MMLERRTLFKADPGLIVALRQHRDASIVLARKAYRDCQPWFMHKMIARARQCNHDVIRLQKHGNSAVR